MTRAQALRDWWGRLAARERGLLVLAAVLVAGALAWFAGLAPALRTLRSAPAQIEQLDRQSQTMQALAAEARGLQGRAALGREEVLRELELSVRQRLGGAAQLSIGADRVTVVLKGAPPQAMAPWLSQARLRARVTAAEARLNRSATGWDGSVVFNLPPVP